MRMQEAVAAMALGRVVDVSHIIHGSSPAGKASIVPGSKVERQVSLG